LGSREWGVGSRAEKTVTFDVFVNCYVIFIEERDHGLKNREVWNEK
jgi:hypothetical protein